MFFPGMTVRRLGEALRMLVEEVMVHPYRVRCSWWENNVRLSAEFDPSELIQGEDPNACPYCDV